MTAKDLLLQEIENTSDELLNEVLDFLRLLKAQPNQTELTYSALVERVDYLEAIVGIRRGLEEFDRGEGIPAAQALQILRTKLKIPPSA